MKKLDAPEKVIYVCAGKKCGRYSKEIRKGFRVEVKECGLKNEVDVVRMDCSDNCKHAPVVSIQPANLWIGEVEEKNVSDIFKKYILNK